MIWIVILVGGPYFILIASFFYGWEKLKVFTIGKEEKSIFISVIIPLRNEEKNITHLLDDLSRQTYPAERYEIIMVDDHSTDHSKESVTKYGGQNCRILSLAANVSGKKEALREGIGNANGELIITTDADCRIKENWLSTMASFYQHEKPVMIMAPVLAYEFLPSTLQSVKPSFLSRMLGLELLSLAGSTAGAAAIGAPVMCNGANLAFSKSIYTEIEHVYLNTGIASGDDIFAMLELKKRYPGRVKFLKSPESTVYSHFPTGVFSFFQQRSRWAAKSRFYKDPIIIFTAITVFGTNFLLLINLLSGILYHNFAPFFVLLLMKSIIDFPFLYRVSAFFGQKKLMVWFPLVQSLYFLYVCITVFVAAVLPISWKERRI
jgi:glycosyltransferase involved in cell wall biosynthesis